MIGNNNIEKTLQYNFLVVMMGEHISWIDHVRTVINKLAMNIDLLYRVSQFLNEDFLKTLYFSYIHFYLSYGDIAWASTYATKLKRVYYVIREIWLGNSKKFICIDQSRFYISLHPREFKNV